MEKEESNYNMLDWWKKVVLKNYANFSGRARRAEYWYFALTNFIIIIPFYILGMVGMANENTTLSIAGFAVYGLFGLGIIIPTLAVAVRRLHDINKSGWYYFVGLIPCIGSIFILIWFFTDGDRFTNNYGDDPKNPGIPTFDFDQKDNQ